LAKLASCEIDGMIEKQLAPTIHYERKTLNPSPVKKAIVWIKYLHTKGEFGGYFRFKKLI